MANATEAPAGAQVGLQQGIDALAEVEIGEADDPRAHPRRSMEVAGAHRSDAVDELRLAVGAIHRVALGVDRGADVVAAADVLENLVEQIARTAIPEMMMRIDDRQLGSDNLLASFAELGLVNCE
ncbi:MAG TPA: hypothetical protein VN715_17915 [Roseiarcus sp.]|nr:hypothetical protein [Roseiarcus sp.]